jgi:uncharacterized protein YlxW (UPF0749 family)
MRTIKGLVIALTVVLLLAACAAQDTAKPAASTDGEKAALEAQVDALTGKVEQLQDRVADLEQENEALQDDSTVSAAEDLTYLLDQISQSGQTLTSFPALVSGMAASGDGFTLTVDRLEYNPDFEAGSGGGGTYLLNGEVKTEEVYVDRFAYAHYDGYLMPELDEGFGDYIKDAAAAQFVIYLLGDRAVYLDEILVP